jgi:fatty-acid desaturase
VTRLERNANIAAVVIPFLGVIAAAVLLWNRFLGWRGVAIFAVMYVSTAMGVTVGFHRLHTRCCRSRSERSYRSSSPRRRHPVYLRVSRFDIAGVQFP